MKKEKEKEKEEEKKNERKERKTKQQQHQNHQQRDPNKNAASPHLTASTDIGTEDATDLPLISHTRITHPYPHAYITSSSTSSQHSHLCTGLARLHRSLLCCRSHGWQPALQSAYHQQLLAVSAASEEQNVHEHWTTKVLFWQTRVSGHLLSPSHCGRRARSFHNILSKAKLTTVPVTNHKQIPRNLQVSHQSTASTK